MVARLNQIRHPETFGICWLSRCSQYYSTTKINSGILSGGAKLIVDFFLFTRNFVGSTKNDFGRGDTGLGNKLLIAYTIETKKTNDKQEYI